MTRIRVATTNPGKLREFREMLEPLGFNAVGIEDLEGLDIIEDGETFEANAVIKANTVAERTGEPTLGDDSGLEVDALGGAPGVRSARYAGVAPPHYDQANRDKLLRELGDRPRSQRTARFVCALAYVVPGQESRVTRGTFEGFIGTQERGENGFGYDPIFELDDGRTAAQLPPEEKNRLSHRGRALEKLKELLQSLD